MASESSAETSPTTSPLAMSQERLEQTLPATEGSDDGIALASTDEVLSRGATVGRYTVLEKIGSGGMGVVYAAFDPQLDRKVALKLMHVGSDPSSGESDGRGRLLREAQAMAKLSHPNVITVHDVGTVGDRVFVAMEFIEGSTLREWLTQQHREWEEIVEAFVRAGRGLAAAHAAGLVHRDFKPDNVLIGKDGRVLVMDFGLARQATRGGTIDAPTTSPQATGRRDLLTLTRTGALLGTPAYMAPEQHRGAAVNAAVDQFSFCVALYEALFGRRPFAGNSVTALAMNVLEGRVREPPRDTRVPPFLRSAILRGLSVHPEDRFPSMDALLAELQRDPVEDRRPWLTTAVALGVAGAMVAGYLAVQPDDEACADRDAPLQETWNDARAERVHEAFAGTKLPYAETTWRTVSDLLVAYEQRFEGAYGRLCESDATARASRPELPPAAGLVCLRRQEHAVDALLDAFESGDPTTVEHAVAALSALPRPEDCEDVRPDPHTEATPQAVATALDGLARMRALVHTGRPRPALEAGRDLMGSVAKLGLPSLHAEMLLVMADAHAAVDATHEAEQRLREAVLVAAEAGRADLEAEGWIRLVALVGLRRELHDEARRMALAAESAIRRSADPSRLRARLLTALGGIDQSQGYYDHALGQYERALELLDGRGASADLAAADVRAKVGLALEGLARFDEALEHHEHVLATRETLLGPQHPDVGIALVALGRAQQGVGALREAEASLVRARMLLDPAARVRVEDLSAPGGAAPAEPADSDAAALGRRSCDLAAALDQLGLLLRADESFEEAAMHHARAAALIERVRGPRHRDLAYPLENLGLALADQRRHAEALPHLRRALEIWTETLDAQHLDRGTAHLNLANSLWAVGDLEGARTHYPDALRIWEEALTPEHPLIGYALTGLGRTYLQSGDPFTATELLERALAIRDHEDEDKINLAETNLLLARALWARRTQLQRALELVIRARDLVGAYEPRDVEALEQVLSGQEVPRFTDQLVPAGLGVSNLRHRYGP